MSWTFPQHCELCDDCIDVYKEPVNIDGEMMVLCECCEEVEATKNNED